MNPIKTFKYRPGPDRFVDENWIYRHEQWRKNWKKYEPDCLYPELQKINMESIQTAKKPQKRKYRAFAWKKGKKMAEIYEGNELLEMLEIAKDEDLIYFTLSVLDRPARR